MLNSVRFTLACIIFVLSNTFVEVTKADETVTDSTVEQHQYLPESQQDKVLNRFNQEVLEVQEHQLIEEDYAHRMLRQTFFCRCVADWEDFYDRPLDGGGRERFLNEYFNPFNDEGETTTTASTRAGSKYFEPQFRQFDPNYQEVSVGKDGWVIVNGITVLPLTNEACIVSQTNAALRAFLQIFYGPNGDRSADSFWKLFRDAAAGNRRELGATEEQDYHEDYDMDEGVEKQGRNWARSLFQLFPSGLGQQRNWNERRKRIRQRTPTFWNQDLAKGTPYEKRETPRLFPCPPDPPTTMQPAAMPIGPPTTESPSNAPSISIEQAPSSPPSMSDVPSLNISSFFPSVAPSSTPSASPSIIPSQSPSNTPSSEPTMTRMPTLQPQLGIGTPPPTRSPTISPMPSISPNGQPSNAPNESFAPSDAPSITPQPSDSPKPTLSMEPNTTSVEPTIIPQPNVTSAEPTITPSSSPKPTLSMEPNATTAEPTLTPKPSASRAPTVFDGPPTSIPNLSIIPVDSVEPTAVTNQPTDTPGTAIPDEPTASPDSTQSPATTPQPSISVRPSLSSNPTSSSEPTDMPTAQPQSDIVVTRSFVRNDVCTGASIIPVEDPVLRFGSTMEASLDKNYGCGAFTGVDNESAGLWYSVHGNGNEFEVTTCFSETDFNTSIQVFSGSCDSLECVVAGGVQSEERCSSNKKGSAASFSTKEGVSYYILIFGRTEADSGTFLVTVHEKLPKFMQL